jgi:hypothetical protein
MRAKRTGGSIISARSFVVEGTTQAGSSNTVHSIIDVSRNCRCAIQTVSVLIQIHDFALRQAREDDHRK